MSEYIDESDDPPTVAGRRISMIDVLAALDSPVPEEQLYEYWELSEEEGEAAIKYVRQHEDELRDSL